MNKLEYLSDHLEAARRRLADCRHGGVVLTGEDLEETIQTFNDFVRMARDLESEISRREWNRRAEADRLTLVSGQGAVVLNAMRPSDSNVVLFPGPGGRSA